MACGVYEIRSPSGRRYIGSAIDIRRRWHQHRTELRCKRHGNSRLQAAWNKYGENAMEFSVIIVCRAEDRAMFEQKCLDHLLPKYNLSPTVGSTLGMPVRQISRDRMRAAQLGKKQSQETLAKRAVHLVGRRVSPETKVKMAAQAGWKHTEKAKEKMRGRNFSADHREKMRLAAIGRIRHTTPHSDATKAVLSAALKGKPRSPESVAKQKAFYAAKRASLGG